MNHIDDEPDPIRDGESTSLQAWGRYWRRSGGYEPYPLSPDQASPSAAALAERAQEILREYKLDALGSDVPIEMREFGEEVHIVADAPDLSQCEIWVDPSETRPEELEELIGESLLAWEPCPRGSGCDLDAQTFFHEAGRRMLDASKGAGGIDDYALSASLLGIQSADTISR